MNKKYEIALEEIRNNFRLQCEGVDKCKESARASLNASGLIIALIGLIEKGNLKSMNLCDPLTKTWILSLLFFTMQVIFYATSINPIGMEAPVNSTNDNFDELFFKQKEKKAIKKLIRKYQSTIKNNRDILSKIAHRTIITNWFGVASILFAVIAIFLGGRLNG